MFPGKGELGSHRPELEGEDEGRQEHDGKGRITIFFNQRSCPSLSPQDYIE